MEALQQLGIDVHSLILYLINFGVIFFLLGKYLYKPIINVLDKRSKLIEGSLQEADLLKNEFQKKMEEMESDKKELQKKVKQETDNLRKFADEKRAEMTKNMELEKAQMMEQAQAEINARLNNILKEAEKQTIEVIKKIVLDIVHNKIPAEIVQDSINEAWEKEQKISA